MEEPKRDLFHESLCVYGKASSHDSLNDLFKLMMKSKKKTRMEEGKKKKTKKAKGS